MGGYAAPVAWKDFPDTSTPLTAANIKAMEAAIVAYGESLFGSLNVFELKGAKDCSTNPNFPAANAGDAYVVSVAGKIGGASGYSVSVGDTYVCVIDGAAAGTKAEVGSKWIVVEVQATVESAVAIEKARAEAAEALKLAKASNLSDVANAATSRGNLGVAYLQTYSKSATLSVEVGTHRFRFPAAAVIDSVAITAGTSPTGASILVDVNKNGTTIFTTQANRPAIAAAGNASTDAVPDVTAIAAGDYLTIDIDQIGSTVPGADLVVTIRYH